MSPTNDPANRRHPKTAFAVVAASAAAALLAACGGVTDQALGTVAPPSTATTVPQTRVMTSLTVADAPAGTVPGAPSEATSTTAPVGPSRLPAGVTALHAGIRYSASSVIEGTDVSFVSPTAAKGTPRADIGPGRLSVFTDDPIVSAFTVLDGRTLRVNFDLALDAGAATPDEIIARTLPYSSADAVRVLLTDPCLISPPEASIVVVDGIHAHAITVVRKHDKDSPPKCHIGPVQAFMTSDGRFPPIFDDTVREFVILDLDNGDPVLLIASGEPGLATLASVHLVPS